MNRLNTFHIGGIHPAQNKTASREIHFLPLPMVAVMPVSQHIGAPAQPVVKKGEHVVRGQEVAVNPSFVSASIHAPITGTVTAVEPAVLPGGKPVTAIIIKATEAEHESDSAARAVYWAEKVPASLGKGADMQPDEVRKKILGAGIVGLGGAAFPSHVKLSVKPGDHPDTLIINGCECEPYLMCDDALMCAYPRQMVEGIHFMMRAAGIPRAVIGIEDNKPEAAAALIEAVGGFADISVMRLRTKYPQGGEKQLVEAVTGRRIGSGQLPLSVGVIVNNVATAFAVWQAIATDTPLIERLLTVTGQIPRSQRLNYMSALGTPLSELPFTLPAQARILMGGPMMGRSVVRLDAPVMKGTSGLTILEGKGRAAVQPCIRCGACVDACPMGLEPYLLATYGRLHMFDEARAAEVADCIECGSCSWSCPSSRPILDYIRVAKQRSRK